jgi:hypothetical protein
MPYIADTVRRRKLDQNATPPETSAELAYVLARAIDRFLFVRKVSYASLAEVAGVLSTTDFEVKRRMLGPHEDAALIKNGDVFTTRVIT